jgi:phosphatidylglycerol:prolipoprotein diacylglycerol transferase
LIDPVIFTIKVGSITWPIYWYGVIIGVAVAAGALIAEREVVKRGGREGYIWEILPVVALWGVIGARLWYVLNDILGGNSQFLEDPIRIFKIWEGGLHIYGAIALGLFVAFRYTRKFPFDRWMLIDAVAPVLLVSQAIGRIGNFINQELYGPPTDLPWGVMIAAEKRMAPWNDLTLYPVETTRFHPTFFYEMIWNLLAAIVIIWLARKLGERFKPGSAFYTWMLLEGVGRFWIEYFRPDQPVIAGTAISYSRIVAALLALMGALMLMVRYEKIKIPFIPPGPDKYLLKDKKWKR